MFIALVAAVAASASMLLGAYWFVRRPQAGAEARLRILAHAGTGVPGTTMSDLRGTAPTSNASPSRRKPFLTSRMFKRMEVRLAAAGLPMSAGAFWLVVLTSTVVMPFAVFMLLTLLFGSVSVFGLFLVGLAATIGAWAPFGWVRNRLHRRQAQLRKELPDLLDLVTLCVESGLGLDGAFRRVSQEMPGALASEVAQMLDEVDLGKPRREALEDFASRASIPEVGVVTAAMIQSQQMGTSLAQTLRSQTNLLRLRRRQRAEQVARQASVKMAFPLVLFLMPSLFLIVLGPIAINIYRALSD